jgi:hypothetical protein
MEVSNPEGTQLQNTMKSRASPIKEQLMGYAHVAQSNGAIANTLAQG